MMNNIGNSFLPYNLFNSRLNNPSIKGDAVWGNLALWISARQNYTGSVECHYESTSLRKAFNNVLALNLHKRNLFWGSRRSSIVLEGTSIKLSFCRSKI